MLYAFQVQEDPFQYDALEGARVMMDAVSNGDERGGGFEAARRAGTGMRQCGKGGRKARS